MATRKENYYITEEARERFRKYLFDQRLSFAAFAKKTGVCRQYLQRVYHGQIPITPKVREAFKRGGYEFL